MTERRRRPTLDQPHFSPLFAPAGESVPRKLRPPAEPANDRLQRRFDPVSQPGICTNSGEKNQLATRP